MTVWGGRASCFAEDYAGAVAEEMVWAAFEMALRDRLGETADLTALKTEASFLAGFLAVDGPPFPGDKWALVLPTGERVTVMATSDEHLETPAPVVDLDVHIAA